MEIDEIAKTLLQTSDVIPITITSVTVATDTYDIAHRGVITTMPMASHTAKQNIIASVDDNQEIDINAKYVLLKVNE